MMVNEPLAPSDPEIIKCEMGELCLKEMKIGSTGYTMGVVSPELHPHNLGFPREYVMNGINTQVGRLDIRAILGPKLLEKKPLKLSGDYFSVVLIFNPQKKVVSAISIMQDGLSSGRPQFFQKVLKFNIDKAHKYLGSRQLSTVSNRVLQEGLADADVFASMVLRDYLESEESSLMTFLEEFVLELESLSAANRADPFFMRSVSEALLRKLVYSRATHAQQFLQFLESMEGWSKPWGDAIQAINVFLFLDESDDLQGQEKPMQHITLHTARALADVMQLIERSGSSGLELYAQTVDLNRWIDEFVANLPEYFPGLSGDVVRQVFLKNIYATKIGGVVPSVSAPIPQLDYPQVLASAQTDYIIYPVTNTGVVTGRNPNSWIRLSAVTDGVTYGGEPWRMDRGPVSADELKRILDGFRVTPNMSDDFLRLELIASA